MYIFSFCVLGDRILSSKGYTNCTKDPNAEGSLYYVYCQKDNSSTTIDGDYKCDEYFENHEARLVQAIPGLSSGVFWGKNLFQ